MQGLKRLWIGACTASRFFGARGFRELGFWVHGVSGRGVGIRSCVGKV